MTELTSISFPDGIRSNRTEAEVRASRVDNLVSMIEVIARGAAQAARAKPLGCPFCGSGPLLPANVLGRYVIECENDNCIASVSVAGDTPSDAVSKWNRRA